MDGRRRTIEVDEDVAVALEKRAAEGGVTLAEFLSQISSADAETVELSSDELVELDARVAEWERDRLGYDAAEVFDWLRDRVTDKDAPLPRIRRY